MASDNSDRQLLDKLTEYGNMPGVWSDFFSSLADDVGKNRMDSISWREMHRDRYLIINILHNNMG